jgi:hypothetical protein
MLIYMEERLGVEEVEEVEVRRRACEKANFQSRVRRLI